MFFARRRRFRMSLVKLIMTFLGLGFMFGRGSALMGKEQKATREIYRLKAKLFWQKLVDAFKVFKVETKIEE